MRENNIKMYFCMTTVDNFYCNINRLQNFTKQNFLTNLNESLLINHI